MEVAKHCSPNAMIPTDCVGGREGGRREREEGGREGEGGKRILRHSNKDCCYEYTVILYLNEVRIDCPDSERSITAGWLEAAAVGEGGGREGGREGGRQA